MVVKGKKCDYMNCGEDATAKGHVYGLIDGGFPVVSCDKHKNESGFVIDSTEPHSNAEAE